MAVTDDIWSLPMAYVPKKIIQLAPAIFSPDTKKTNVVEGRWKVTVEASATINNAR